MPRSVTLLGALGALVLAREPIAPHSAIETAGGHGRGIARRRHQSVTADLLTTGEKSTWNLTAPYAECVEIAHRLEA